MSENLMDLSGKIDEATIELLETISHVAQAVGVPFFVVGATARDTILTKGYGIRTIRATYDVDLGVQVPDWDQYARLIEALLKREEFESSREAQRLIYRGSQMIDFIPFGKIGDPGKSIRWPSDDEIEMSTMGFDESYHHSLTVRLRSEPVFEVQFVSLTGLAVLKIFAWNDDRPRRSRDALDLALIMRKYVDAGNLERFYEEESDIVEIENFDFEIGSARLLGRDIAATFRRETSQAILEILERETGEQHRYRLVEDMLSGDDFEEKLQQLEALKVGIIDRLLPSEGGDKGVAS
jgi:predicted nucleotidyltransferase